MALLKPVASKAFLTRAPSPCFGRAQRSIPDMHAAAASTAARPQTLPYAADASTGPGSAATVASSAPGRESTIPSAMALHLLLLELCHPRFHHTRRHCGCACGTMLAQAQGVAVTAAAKMKVTAQSCPGIAGPLERRQESPPQCTSLLSTSGWSCG